MSEVLKFRIKEIAYGWCRVQMLINDKEIEFDASCLGPNPLDTFIKACLKFLIAIENDEVGLDGKYNISWLTEPGELKIDLNLDNVHLLHLDILEVEEETTYNEWHEIIPYQDFVSEVIREGYRVINTLGLYGYQCSWSDNLEFPLSSLLRISTTIKPQQLGDCESYITDVFREIECISQHLSNKGIIHEKRFDYSKIYIEGWQIVDDNASFSIGQEIDWTCKLPEYYKYAHGIIMDFEADSHGFATHSIKGSISKIMEEWSELLQGKGEVWYHKAYTHKEERLSVKGKDIRNDRDVTRKLWGYIVELKNVIVKPLTE